MRKYVYLLHDHQIFEDTLYWIPQIQYITSWSLRKGFNVIPTTNAHCCDRFVLVVVIHMSSQLCSSSRFQGAQQYLLQPLTPRSLRSQHHPLHHPLFLSISLHTRFPPIMQSVVPGAPENMVGVTLSEADGAGRGGRSGALCPLLSLFTPVCSL